MCDGLYLVALATARWLTEHETACGSTRPKAEADFLEELTFNIQIFDDCFYNPIYFF